jgi:hypothetical protein
VNAAEIVVSEVQCDGHLEIQQFLAESIRQARESAGCHPHRQVLALYKASRNVPRIRIAAAYLGYNLRDSWWGVPRIGAIVLAEVTEQFHKLREVYI